MPDDTDSKEWKDLYFEQQRQLADKIGCIAHPSDIIDAIADLRRRAAGHDRERAGRKEFLVNAMIKTLQDLGYTQLEINRVTIDLARIATRLVDP